MATRPSDWHPQEWLLVAEALAQFAGDSDPDDPRKAHAHRLIESIAAQEGLTPSDLLYQIDDEWITQTGQPTYR